MEFRGLAARFCGVDPDERVLENPYLDDARVGVGEAIPYEDATFDGVFSDSSSTSRIPRRCSAR
jgi:hypothetical protein